MDFYAAKIVRRDGRVSRLISLFAESDDGADRAIKASNHYRDGDTVFVANISNSTPAEFANWGDEAGIVEHSDFVFTDDGPIDGETLFEQGVKKV